MLWGPPGRGWATHRCYPAAVFGPKGFPQAAPCQRSLLLPLLGLTLLLLSRTPGVPAAETLTPETLFYVYYARQAVYGPWRVLLYALGSRVCFHLGGASLGHSGFPRKVSEVFSKKTLGSLLTWGFLGAALLQLLWATLCLLRAAHDWFWWPTLSWVTAVPEPSVALANGLPGLALLLSLLRTLGAGSAPEPPTFMQGPLARRFFWLGSQSFRLWASLPLLLSSLLLLLPTLWALEPCQPLLLRLLHPLMPPLTQLLTQLGPPLEHFTEVYHRLGQTQRSLLTETPLENYHPPCRSPEVFTLWQGYGYFLGALHLGQRAWESFGNQKYSAAPPPAASGFWEPRGLLLRFRFLLRFLPLLGYLGLTGFYGGLALLALAEMGQRLTLWAWPELLRASAGLALSSAQANGLLGLALGVGSGNRLHRAYVHRASAGIFQGLWQTLGGLLGLTLGGLLLLLGLGEMPLFAPTLAQPLLFLKFVFW